MSRMKNNDQGISKEEVEIRAKLNSFRKDAERSLRESSLLKWWIGSVIKAKVPIIKLLFR